MRNAKRISLLLAAFLSLSSFAYAAPEKGAKQPLPKVDVYVVPKAQDLALSLNYPAQVYAAKSVKVVARVSGVLEEKYFKEGSYFHKGDKLYKIEDTIYKAQVDASKASVAQAQATLDNATRNWKRVQKLFKKRAVSVETRDNNLAAYNQALAALALAKANLNQSQIDLDYTLVKAPISGIVGIKQVDIGDYVSAAVPTTLISITQNNSVNVEFSMPLRDFMKIKNGIWNLPKNNKAEISLQLDNKSVKKIGVIDFIDVNADKDTSTVKIRAVVDNSDGYLMPGSFIRIGTNDIYEKSIIVIPQKAVLQNPLGTVVFVEDKGVVAVRPVKIGNESADKFVITGGALKSGEKVIINNFFRIKPGSKVSVDKIINQ
jgi:membrane fusion protein (multidrug efflux system)